MVLSDSTIRTLANEWFEALDRHAPLDEVMRFLSNDDEFEMRLPEGVLRGSSGFADWYGMATTRFFDQRQTITSLATESTGDEADEVSVDIDVNWQARTRNPSGPTSQWIGFDVKQTWVVVPGSDGTGAKIKTYSINGLTPMPGSASL